MVHTLNVVHLRVVPDDRRERTREAKRLRILAAAGAVIDRDGLAGVTMQAVADQLDCAVGTLYTAFSGKAELLAALQAEAVATLEASYRTARAGWEEHLATEEVEPAVAPLVELLAYAGFVAAAGVVFHDEVALVRALLGEASPSAPALDRADGPQQLPVLHRLLDAPVDRLEAAIAAEVLTPGDATARALVWVASLFGVLRLERLAPLDRHLFRAQGLARSLSEDLLVGWGASRPDVEVASTWVEQLSARGPLAPPPG
jgi:AcrR family transcriptional regulator